MRLIDADKLTERFKFLIEDNEELLTSSIVRAVVLTTVALMPAVDAVSVVRCKDCENWDRELMHNDRSCFCPMLDLWTDETFFCPNGERKDEKE